MRLDRIEYLPTAVLAAAFLVLPSVHCDDRSSVNVALKASFPPAPYLVELMYARTTCFALRQTADNIAERQPL